MSPLRARRDDWTLVVRVADLATDMAEQAGANPEAVRKLRRVLTHIKETSK